MKNTIKCILLLFTFFSISSSTIFAADFSRVSLRYDRMKTSTLTGAQLVFVPVTAGTNKISIIFGTGVSVSTTQTGNTTNLPSGYIGVPGTLSFTKVGNSQVDITGITALTIGNTYAVNIGAGLSTPTIASAQIIDYVNTYNGATLLDHGGVASYFISNDQVVITASVAPLFTFYISSGGNTDAFSSDLTGSSVFSSNGFDVTATTNAPRGWIGWLRSNNTGVGGSSALSSSLTGESIGTIGVLGDNTPSTCTAGTDCYLIGAAIKSGANTYINNEFNNAGNQGGTIATANQAFQPFGGGTSKTSGDVITLKTKVSIIATKAAGGDYTDTINLVGCGNF